MATNKKQTHLANENGLTLIELMAALALSSILMIGLWSIFMSGIGATERIQQNTKTQHEVNLVILTIRNAHLSNEPYTLTLTDTKIQLNDETIATGYTYSGDIEYNGTVYTTGETFRVTTKSPLRLNLSVTNNQTGKQQDIRTTIQKEGE